MKSIEKFIAEYDEAQEALDRLIGQAQLQKRQNKLGMSTKLAGVLTQLTNRSWCPSDSCVGAWTVSPEPRLKYDLRGRIIRIGSAVEGDDEDYTAADGHWTAVAWGELHDWNGGRGYQHREGSKPHTTPGAAAEETFELMEALRATLEDVKS